MRPHLLYRVRTFDGVEETRGNFKKDMGEVVSFVLKHVQGNTPGAWMAVDIMYPDGTVEEKETSWTSAEGMSSTGNSERNFRPRCGGGRGLEFTGSWVAESIARSQWMEAAAEYDGVPVAWSVMDRRLPDGSVEIYRRWTASPEAVIKEPVQVRRSRRLPR